MGALRGYLSKLLITSQISGNVSEVLVPYLTAKYKIFAAKEALRAERNSAVAPAGAAVVAAAAAEKARGRKDSMEEYARSSGHCLEVRPPLYSFLSATT